MTSPELTLVQISDTHLVAGGGSLAGGVDPAGLLAAALGVVAGSGARVSALLLTGDLADAGAPEAYARLRELVEPCAERLGARVVYVMGNHDDRTAFRAGLLGGGPTDAVHDVDGLRVIVLDSTTPGRHDGRLEPEQLAWLREVLAEPARRGTLLALHHPPVRSPVPTVDLLRLADADRLADAVAGSDVRMVLAGHAHHVGCGALGAVPVWVGPALAYRIDALPPRDRLRGVVGPGISRVDLVGGQVVATAVDLTPAVAVYDADEADMVRTVRELVG